MVIQKWLICCNVRTFVWFFSSSVSEILRTACVFLDSRWRNTNLGKLSIAFRLLVTVQLVIFYSPSPAKIFVIRVLKASYFPYPSPTTFMILKIRHLTSNSANHNSWLFFRWFFKTYHIIHLRWVIHRTRWHCVSQSIVLGPDDAIFVTRITHCSSSHSLPICVV